MTAGVRCAGSRIASLPHSSKEPMKNLFRWGALIAVAILMAALVAPEHVPLAATLVSDPGATVGPAFYASIAGLSLIGTTLPPVDLQNKSREAQELRGKSNEIRSKLADSAIKLTKDEAKAMLDEIQALELRANHLAEFTGDAEIRRQGGDGGLTRLGEEVLPGNEKRLSRATMDKQIANFTERVKGEFGDVRSFMGVAVAGNPGSRYNVTEKQAAMIREAHELTRAIVGTTGDVSGGEYLLPLTQVASIFSLSNVQQGMLQRARAYNVPGRTLRIPYLIQDDAAASTTLNRPMAGNIANVNIIGEAVTKEVRAPKFGQRLLTVYKYAAYTQVSDELLSDDFTGELPAEFINAVGQQALNAVNEDITIDGSGTSEPTGALYAGGAWTITVARNTASTIKPDDLFNMYARHTHGPGSVWLASRRTVQALFAMSLTSASLVTYLRDLNNRPEMNILGYPVILTDLLPTLGSTGDLALVNPDFYAFALRQALTVELSRDYAFVDDLTTYRFVVRAGGIPINPGKFAYKYAGTSGVDEHSPFVYLT